MTAKAFIYKVFSKISPAHILRCLMISVISLTSFSAHAQNNENFPVTDIFNSYREKNFQEKIYLHTDKSLYVTGEILWCKAYVTDAHLHQSSDISKVAYLELIDANQKPAWQSTIGLEKGKGEASLVIPSTVITGNYTLRCYTNWMKNQDPSFYFEKNITLINPLKKPIALITADPDQFFVDFFPEGGHLVTGLPTKMGIKATDRSGKGIQAEGILISSEMDTVLRFTTGEKGLGKCRLTPEPGKTYQAFVRKSGGAWQPYSLPEISASGYTMELDEKDPENITITVFSNPEQSASPCYLFVHCRQAFMQAVVSGFSQGKAAFKIRKAGLGEGISHFTIFNESRQPVLERLYFKVPKNLLHLKVSVNKSLYAAREKIEVDLQASLPGGTDADASLSAAVIRLDADTITEDENIISYLYLTSDQPGWIESPASYFRGTDKTANETADLLMLTHGWRRFDWKDILQKKSPAFLYLPEYSGQIITGKLVDKDGKPAGAGKTGYASIPGNRYQTVIGRSDEEGTIHFPFTQTAGTAVLAIQADLKTDSLLQVDWQSPFSAKYSLKKMPAFTIEGKSATGISERISTIQLQQVYTGEKMQSFLPPVISDTTSFFGLADKNYFLDEYTRFRTMEEVFREFVPEVEVRKNKNNFRLLVNNLPYKAYFREDPLMLLDGVPFTDVNKVMQFDPLQIKNIGIVARRYYAGGLTYPGVISFQTYNGDLAGFTLAPQVLLVDYAGVQVKRSFYAPQYTTPNESAIPFT